MSSWQLKLAITAFQKLDKLHAALLAPPARGISVVIHLAAVQTFIDIYSVERQALWEAQRALVFAFKEMRKSMTSVL